MISLYAHSTETADKSEWQSLVDHLQGVAQRAEAFADAFDAGEWGRCAGLLHDVGKASEAFQRRLEGSTERVDHSSFGARVAKDDFGQLGCLLAYIVAGHHGGLPDGGEQERQLHYRLKHAALSDDIKPQDVIIPRQQLSLPFKLTREQAGFTLSFLTRMIYSCLVDADFQDTESFCTPHRSQDRETAEKVDPLTGLQEKLNGALGKICRDAELTPVNVLRQSILSQCRGKASLPPGIYSLTVPTGGGKTLSSMAFALDHAVRHGLRRIIYTIPFTSIIEQNARVFQEIFGTEAVLEHHCNFKEQDEPELAAYNRRRGLVAENWNAPVVVTTNVQFFESLFSNKPSRCRKLHNIARSVIVLDEAQAIPTEYLEPCLAALRELVEHYHCSIMLCTATQPALDDSSSLRMALPEIQEIVDSPQQLYDGLRRTKISFTGKLLDCELALQVQNEQQVLCIVSTKAHARTLYERLAEDEGTFHLSTNMYPQHRRRVLMCIRERLEKGQTCRVVSTSLVEAGVDLDFPVVYRAMAGLDSIAQAAGRCNREGRMEGLGRVYVFEPETGPRIPWMKRCISRAQEALRSLSGSDPLGLDVMRRYFELLYDVQDLDLKRMMALLNPPLDKELYLPFREAADAFKLIDEESVGLIVAIEPEAERLVRDLRRSERPRPVLRKLQQYSVAVRHKQFAQLVSRGLVELIHGEIPLLLDKTIYNDSVGLCAEGRDA